MSILAQLEKALLTKDVTQIQTAVDEIPRVSHLIGLFRDTNNLVNLHVLVPLISDKEIDLVASIITNTIEQGDQTLAKELVSMFNFSGMKPMLGNRLSYHLGRRGLPINDKPCNKGLHISGLIAGDRDEALFTTYNFCATKGMVKHKSYKCMLHIITNKTMFRDLFYDCLDLQSEDVLQFLILKNKDWCNDFFNGDAITLVLENIEFGLKNGLVLTQETYADIKIRNLVLYQQLQEQV